MVLYSIKNVDTISLMGGVEAIAGLEVTNSKEMDMILMGMVRTILSIIFI